MTFTVAAYARSPRFDSDVKRLPPDVRSRLVDALELLRSNPWAKSLRLHSLKGYPRPTIWKIDLAANRSWQVTFELHGTTALLLRVDEHKALDRLPRA